MGKKSSKKTKTKIIAAAWKLFYEQGYEDTTVEEIIAESQTSKGSFYHYFEGKDALLETLSVMFDEKYEELKGEISDEQDSMEVLLFLNRELFGMIEHSMDHELLSRLYSTQLTTKGQRHLLDYSRVYFKLLRQIITKGKERGELTEELSVSEMVKHYAMCERAIIYDWCLCNGEYSIYEYTCKMFPKLIECLRNKRR